MTIAVNQVSQNLSDTDQMKLELVIYDEIATSVLDLGYDANSRKNAGHEAEKLRGLIAARSGHKNKEN